MSAVEAEELACSCCGTGIRDTVEENVSLGVVPYPHDTGVGLCRGCGGDPLAKSVRAKMGWAMCAFVDAHIRVVADHLSPNQREKFLAFPYAKKAAFVLRAVEKGLLI